MIRLVILVLTIASAVVLSSSENPPTSVKSSSTPQQQQQDNSRKTSSLHDDPMLNAINAYSKQYETSTGPPQSPRFSQQIFSPQYNPSQPSSPKIESDFQPMPALPQQQPHSLSTPVIMQYLPQSLQLSDSGVQYLQLIPTRPLLVPISPFMPPMHQAFQAPTILPNRNDIPIPQNTINSHPYEGLQTYANTLQNYRSYRINREIKPNNIPDDLGLNTNEYIPSPNDPQKSTRVRGRP